MNIIQTTAVMRNRGQLTIPDKIRNILGWVKTDSVITIKVIGKNELLIRPYQFEGNNNNWQKIWNNIELSRSFKGGAGNLSKFIAEDRENR